MKKPIFILLLVCMLLASGCSQKNGTDNQGQPSTEGKAKSDTSIDISDLFSSRDFEVEYDESKSHLIELHGETATSDSDAVKISGSTVTITDEGTYILSGTLKDGEIVVDTGKKDKVQLVLNNVSIHSRSSAPIYIRKSDKVFITLAEDSVNTLSNGGIFSANDENNIDAVIFPKEDLTLNGSGILTITSPAGHGIVSKDELTLTGGTYRIDSAFHGLSGNDNVCIANGEINITSGKDGIHAENDDDPSLGFVYIRSGTFNIASNGDGIASSAWMQIDGGTFYIVSGGGSAKTEKMSSGTKGTDTKDNSASTKGIKAVGNLTIIKGDFTIDAADDAFHSNASMNISGGTFQIVTGNDGFHADENLTVSSGTINIAKCYEGLEGLRVEILGGDIAMYASDDGINAAGGNDQSGFGGGHNDRFAGGRGGKSSSKGSIVISGGKLYINAAGDGMDANGTLTISGGYTVVCGPTVGDTATLDYDDSGTIKGGTFIGTGASRMAKSFSDSEQGVILVKVDNQPAGTAIALIDADGNTIIPAYVPELDFEVVILSSPDIKKGETYRITIGSTTFEVTAS